MNDMPHLRVACVNTTWSSLFGQLHLSASSLPRVPIMVLSVWARGRDWGIQPLDSTHQLGTNHEATSYACVCLHTQYRAVDVCSQRDPFLARTVCVSAPPGMYMSGAGFITQPLLHAGKPSLTVMSMTLSPPAPCLTPSASYPLLMSNRSPCSNQEGPLPPSLSPAPAAPAQTRGLLRETTWLCSWLECVCVLMLCVDVTMIHT